MGIDPLRYAGRRVAERFRNVGGRESQRCHLRGEGVAGIVRRHADISVEASDAARQPTSRRCFAQRTAPEGAVSVPEERVTYPRSLTLLPRHDLERPAKPAR